LTARASNGTEDTSIPMRLLIADARRQDKGDDMDLSARNTLRGTVKSVKSGSVMAEVVIDIGGQEIVSAITRASVERLKLQPGDRVVAIVKSTDVMVGK